MQEPEKYLPERFIEGTPEFKAKPAHGYMPFGDGLRQCIGLRFAIMEVSHLESIFLMVRLQSVPLDMKHMNA